MNDQIKDGGPAFPHHDSGDTGTRPGMTLRDYFAASADVSDLMKGMTSNDADRIGIPMPSNSDTLAWAVWRAKVKSRLRFIEADAMLAAREVS
jgi:hypothetical protein